MLHHLVHRALIMEILYRSYIYTYMEMDNEHIIELLYTLNYFPSLKKLTNIVQQKSPEITKAEITQFHEKHITTQLTK